MARHLIKASTGDSVEKVINTMRDFSISQMPVFYKGKVIGGISETIIIRNLHRNLRKLKVRDIMEKPFPIVSVYDPVEIASNLLGYHPAVLVSDKGNIVGIITKSDLLGICLER